MVPTFPSSMSFNSASNDICPVLLFGDSAISTIIVPIGILPSGKPTRRDALIAASNLGPISGFAKPISSYAITDNLLNKESRSSS